MDIDSSEYRQTQLLAELGFHTVEPKLCTIADIQVYAEHYLSKLRGMWPYETDGLIISLDDSKLFEAIDALWVVNHHHHYAIALKPPADCGTTLLQEVHWQVGRQGRLTPVAEFFPLKLASAVIERASLHNYANVQRLNIHRGDVLEIERAGDVIPYVRRNLGTPQNFCNLKAQDSAEGIGDLKNCPPLDCYTDEVPISMLQADAISKQIIEQMGPHVVPSRCPFCNSNLVEKSVDLFCSQQQCPEQIIQRILFWVQRANMEQIAERTLRQFYQAGKLRNLKDLYNITEDDLKEMQGYRKRKITNFFRELNHSRRMTVHQLIERLGIPLVQQKSLLKLGELRRKTRWEIFIERVRQELQQRKDEKFLAATWKEAVAAAYRDNFSGGMAGIPGEGIAENSQDPIDLLLQSLLGPNGLCKNWRELWLLWKTGSGRNKIYKNERSKKEWAALRETQVLGQAPNPKEWQSRWNKFIKQVGDCWLIKELEQTGTLLDAVIQDISSEILPDWSGDKAKFSRQLREDLPSAKFFRDRANRLPACVLQESDKSFLALLQFWSGDNKLEELWYEGFPVWQELLLSAHPDYLELVEIEDFTRFNEPNSRYTVVKNLQLWVRENQVLLQELLPVLDLQEGNPQSPRHAQENAKSICLTGSGPLPRKELQEKLQAAGFRIHTAPTQTTNILLCADPSANSSKLKKARSGGIAIYSYNEFLANLEAGYPPSEGS
ncbi:MAG: BRCT domain-containing protein [Spirochaetota bacterium]